MCAAVAAARHGARVVLIQERPMLGGNASSEIRMWVCGAQGANMRETGLIEELMLENYYRNPDKNYHIWDGILYDLAVREKNITLLLNCSVNACETADGRIVSVTGWQMTTQQFHRVYARVFADCSGDSILAPLTGAEYRHGRESESEFGEELGRGITAGDTGTMGMSCILEAREEDRESVFIPPAWAARLTAEDLRHRVPDLSSPLENYWYLELGGDGDSIADTEKTRHELLRLAYGLWDYIKNDPEQREKNRNWRLDWVGILPGKRESRRYVGDYVLTQNDVRSEGRFDDIVAYGGWPMDDHDPRGFRNGGRPNVNYPAPSPYGIPFRSLYSKNVPNLLFAGRNISVTHWALSSCRVMGTCAVVGQAAGTAAAIAVRENCLPRDVYEKHVGELKQMLMEDDCYLPFNRRAVPELTRKARITGVGNAENLRNGIDRPVGDEDNGCFIEPGGSAEYLFDKPEPVARVRIVWDSELDRRSMPGINGVRFVHNMLCNRPLHMQDFHVPHAMTRAYRIEGILPDGSCETIFRADNNYQRLNEIAVSGVWRGVRLVPESTWGAEASHVFAFEVS